MELSYKNDTISLILAVRISLYMMWRVLVLELLFELVLGGSLNVAEWLRHANSEFGSSLRLTGRDG